MRLTDVTKGTKGTVNDDVREAVWVLVVVLLDVDVRVVEEEEVAVRDLVEVRVTEAVVDDETGDEGRGGKWLEGWDTMHFNFITAHTCRCTRG